MTERPQFTPCRWFNCEDFEPAEFTPVGNYAPLAYDPNYWMPTYLPPHWVRAHVAADGFPMVEIMSGWPPSFVVEEVCRRVDQPWPS